MSYIGKAPGFGIRNRYYYTATAAQTTFSGADDNGQTLAYADSKYLDVYLNGVLLVAGTDYTATTLTSVTLTSGASAADIIEIVAYDIFSVADTVSSASGGTFNGAVTFDAGLNTDTISEATSGSGVTIDGVLLKDNDIEATDGTFSGGVYLGGTGAANYLDDYEEGTHQVSLTCTTSGTITLDSTADLIRYTKIGNVVTLQGRVFVSSVSSPSGGVQFSLPFAVASGAKASGYTALSLYLHAVDFPAGAVQLFAEAGTSTSYATFYYLRDNASWEALPASGFDATGTEIIYVTGSYMTDS